MGHLTPTKDRTGPWEVAVSSPRLLIVVSVAAAVLTVMAEALPSQPLTGPAALRVAIDTAIGVAALVAGFLLFNRFRETRDVRDLILVVAFLVLLVANLWFSSIPALLGYSPSRLAMWSSAAAQLSGSLALAAAAYRRPRRIRSEGRPTTIWLVGTTVLLATIFVVVALVGDAPPAGARPGSAGPVVPGPDPAGGDLMAAAQLLAALALAWSAIGFERRARRTGDGLLHWIAPACMLLAFAFLNCFLASSLYGEAVSPGELLLGAGYAVLLVGALAEIGVYPWQAATAAKAQERDAIAQDMHDVLAQDLAFLAGRLRELALKAEVEDRRDRDLLGMLSSAAHRALDQSRVAAWSLARPDTPLEDAVEQTTEEIARREGASVLVQTEAGLEVPDALKHALLCIVREAATNAIRHGDPTHVEVRLFQDDGIRLEVSDSGKGFVAERPGGLGLTTIRQRAGAFGGSATITSTPGEGTVVEVHVPAEAVGADHRGSDVPSGHRPRPARPRSNLELQTAG